jgi:hypothetical protein
MRARELVTSRGGVNSRFLAVPPSLVSFEEREDEWWREGQVEPVDPPPIAAFRANYLAPTAAAVDPVRVALEALLDDHTTFEWTPRIIAALARPVVATD